MRKYLVALAFLSSSAFSTAGFAQDWTGFYIGAHGGYAWSDIDYPGLNPYVAPPAPCGGCGPPRASLEGGLLGGQVGYNFQFSNLVLGIEVDYAFGDLSETVRDGNYLVQTHEISGLGSVRGRLGYAIGDNILPYVTGGWGWAKASLGQSCPNDARAVVSGYCSGVTATQGGPHNLTDEQTIDGWVLGGGVEYRISDNWSIKAEYLHYDFDE
ncbi:outer membrane beta-barrel protein, partial [Hyphomicrobium sp.]|uniref:outer membrane protein n=1 Tax=Hyphomicrobium sp. TaxID=82 RepID=UPI0025B7F88B